MAGPFSIMISLVALFALVFGMFFLYINARNKERMALIEKGAEASIFFSTKSKPSGKYGSLRIGMLLIGLAIGIIIGYLITHLGVPEPAAYLSMIFFFGGLSLILFYFIFRHNN